MIIESVSQSVERRRFYYQGAQYLMNIPFKPIYASGGLILYFIVKIMNGYRWYEVVLTATLAITIWEYFGGWFCVEILKERLWSYANKGFHINEHISLWSTKWWLILITVFYFFVFGWVEKIDQYLATTLVIPTRLDMLVMVVFIGFISALTLHRRRKIIKKRKR